MNKYHKIWSLFQSLLTGFPPGSVVWIGLNSIAYQDKWVWADGEKLKVTKYSLGAWYFYNQQK